MNRIFPLLLALLACTAHVSAQTTADTLRAGATVSGDTLIAVDEQVLVERLAQLLRERRAQHRHNRETADFLRTQLLFTLLDARNTPAQPLVTVPTQSATAQTTTTTSDAAELYRWQFEQINARLSAIEQRLNGSAPAVRDTTESTVDQSTLETLLRNRQELERQLKNSNRTTVVPTPIPIPGDSSSTNDSRVSELEKRIATLEEQRNALIAQRDTLVRSLMAQRMSAQPAPSTGVTVSTVAVPAVPQTKVVTEEQVVEVPGDFRRTVYFRVSSAAISTSGAAKLRETADFLKRYPTARVAISGYASPDGRRASNERLAAHRLMAVVNQLHKLGVPALRIVAAESGISAPTVSHDFGRRVEITLAP